MKKHRKLFVFVVILILFAGVFDLSPDKIKEVFKEKEAEVTN